jgi:hypothetical protein
MTDRTVAMNFKGRKIRTLKPRKNETCKMLVIAVEGNDNHAETAATIKKGEMHEERIKKGEKYILDAMDAPERKTVEIKGRSRGVYVSIEAIYRRVRDSDYALAELIHIRNDINKIIDKIEKPRCGVCGKLLIDMEW